MLNNYTYYMVIRKKSLLLASFRVQFAQALYYAASKIMLEAIYSKDI